jgi:predicted membrane-bound dolichyl-phosphate-mannose-protein mannosyltransferase/Gpi18-like mannosyltransferase
VITEPSRRRLRLVLLGVFGAGLLLRIAVLPATGFTIDINTFIAWSNRLADVGPSEFYQPGYFSDYPPGYLYLLWIVALALGGMPALVAKALPIPFDLGIALALYLVQRRLADERSATTAATLYLLNPGLVLAGPYWGQADAVGTLPFLLALVAAGTGRFAAAGALGGVAALVKPQFGLGLVVVSLAAAVQLLRNRRLGPLVRVVASALLTTVALIPFRMDLRGYADLVEQASRTYEQTSLYAYNIWAIIADFWKPDDQRFLALSYQQWGAVLFVLALAGIFAFLWREAPSAGASQGEGARAVGLLLAAGALAVFAFYFLPTRVHERYLFPAFAFLAPFAALRLRFLGAYALLAALFALSVFHAFTRYPEYTGGVLAPQLLEATLYQRPAVIVVSAIGLLTAGALAWWWTRERDFSLGALGLADASSLLRLPSFERVALPRGLRLGAPPSRRDVAAALLVALLVLATRGYRLDWPRDMYFDEVYHARTAFELLAQREPYEWTHPPLAKEIMALGILAFGDDRVVGHEPGEPGAVGFAVTNDGRRVYLTPESVKVVARDGPTRNYPNDPAFPTPTAVVMVGDDIVAVSDLAFVRIDPAGNATTTRRADGLRSNAAAAAGTLVAVGGESGLAIYPALGAPPVRVSTKTVALSTKPDGSEVYALDGAGVVHVIAAETGEERRVLTGGQPGTAMAYAQGPNRLFVARAAAPMLDVYEIETGSHEAVPLANARTGTFASGATALAVVPRTGFLYALADGRAVVVETYGTSPFVSIPVTGTLLGIDGDDDKLLVAGSSGAELIETGRHALAWRLPGVAFAALLAFFVVLLARRLFASAVLPAIVGLVVLLDGSMYAQARIGMNDVYVGALIVAGWYFVVAAHRPRRSAALDILLAGIAFGLAAAAKWAAFYALAGVLVAAIAVTARAYERGQPGSGGPLDILAGRGRNAALLLVSFAVLPAAIYLASYVAWFGGPTIPYDWNLVEATKQMYWYHSSLTAPHPAGSPWWTWPLVLKPVYWYFGQSSGGENAYIYDAGNVALFWAGIVAFGWCALSAVRARSVALGFVVFAALMQYVPWIPIGRVLFFYHFFTALPFYLLALAAGLAYLWETRRERWVVGFLAVAAASFAYFYPFISAQPFPGAQAGMFFILPTWSYDCQFYPTLVCAPVLGSSFSFAALFGRLALSLAAAAALTLLIVAGSRPVLLRLWATARPGARR